MRRRSGLDWGVRQPIFGPLPQQHILVFRKDGR